MTTEVLYRTLPVELEVRAAGQGGDGRTVEGIAVPFGRAQRIDDTLTEQFARGAFDHQMAAIHRIRFTAEHMSQGGTPIGRIVEARDDVKGLWVAMRVSATPRGDERLTLIRDGVVNELSVGFHARPQGSARLANGVVERRRADLFEIASVLEGAYGQSARVLAVRAIDDDALLVEDNTPEAAGMTLEEARRLAAQVPILSAAALTG